jgi:hypothetical protein
MATIHLAYTAPINPPDASPVLTQAHVFAGMRRKVRKAHEFVPVITDCEVLSEEGNVVTRKVQFRPGGGPGLVTEVCTEYAPARVDFEQDNGSSVKNIVAAGPSGRDDDLFMTYLFAWKRDDLEEGTDAYKEAVETYKKVRCGWRVGLPAKPVCAN